MSKKDFERVDFSVKGTTKDIYAFTKLVPERKKRIKKASADPIEEDVMNDLANKLHPITQFVKIDEIIEETKTSKTFKLVPDSDSPTKELAYFRAGQYISIKTEVEGTSITRPYSISSSPTDSLRGFYNITIRKEEDGFLTNYAFENWRVGTQLKTSGPEGSFYYEALRDKKNIVGLAGGSGITPFRSMAREIAEGNLDIHLTIIYGSSDEEDILFYNELKELEKKYSDKIKLVIVLSCDEVTLKNCETGFITSEIVKKYVDIDNSSFFICGPQIMYEFVDKQLTDFNLPPKRVRRELFGEMKDPLKLPNFPSDIKDKSFNIKVNIGGITKQIPSKGIETVLVALERAKLSPPSLCRSGECGFCRSRLLSGEVYINPKNDGRREADKKFNIFHPCSSYPLSNLEIEIPRTKN